MSRWVWFSICAILGLVMLACGLVVPSHLRAVDARVLQRAGRRTPALLEQGLALARDRQLGAAHLIFEAGQKAGLSEAEGLDLEVGSLSNQHPEAFIWGGSQPPWAGALKTDPKQAKPGSEPFTELVLQLENRAKVLELLAASSNPAVRELMRSRALTNTVLFPASHSAAGQAFDAAISVCGLLVVEGRLRNGLEADVSALAAEANRGGDSQHFEQLLLDFMSLGQRFNWGQLEIFISQVDGAESLRLLATQVRNAGPHLAELFAAVELSGRPAEVTKYLLNFNQSGPKDLGASLRYGAGGMNELLDRNLPFYESKFLERLAAIPPLPAFSAFALGYAWLMPGVAMTAKWLLYLAAGFLIALALHFAQPAVPALERPLLVPGFHIAREILFALGFLLVVLLISEPFLSQESQKVAVPFRLRLPRMAGATPARTAQAPAPPMNNSNLNLNLLTLLLFFVVQALIFTACLLKLAEIRRQPLPAYLKLKILENEEHLFDAGLYLGFACTIICLILVSFKTIQLSLLGAYSSTAFGIVFVSAFKIFRLRPARRILLLEADAAAQANAPRPNTPSFAAASAS